MHPFHPLSLLHNRFLARAISPSAVLLISILAQSCVPPSRQNAVPPAPTLPPVWTPTTATAPPTPLPTATGTPRPSATPGCELTSTLRQVKASIPYDQKAVAFAVINGRGSLAVWYVDPKLEPFPSTSQLQQQLREAKLRAAEVAKIVSASSPCSSRIFDVINPIVVDKRYQGWFSGEIRPGDLPTGQAPSQEELARAADRFRVGYLRTSLSHPYKEGACEWPEARERLQSHFSADRELVAFYFVIDDLGSHVWVHWDGEADLIMEIATIGNISLALECFSPTADVIYAVVAADGRLLDAGVLPPHEQQ